MTWYVTKIDNSGRANGMCVKSTQGAKKYGKTDGPCITVIINGLASVAGLEGAKECPLFASWVVVQ